MKIFGRFFTAAGVTALFALASWGVGSLVSAHPSDTDASLIHACFNTTNGTLRLVAPHLTGDAPEEQRNCHEPEVAIHWPATANGNGNGATIIGGGTGSTNLSQTDDRFVPLYYADVSATESKEQQAMPLEGLVSDLYVRLDSTTTANGTYTFTLRKNGADQAAVQCTVAANSQTCSDLTGSVCFEVADLITVKSDPTGPPGPKEMQWTAKFTPGLCS